MIVEIGSHGEPRHYDPTAADEETRDLIHALTEVVRDARDY